MSDITEDQKELAWQPDAHSLVLDGIRGLAILSVTLYRLLKEVDPTQHTALATIRRFAPIGERGVDLFFVLSGFLITGILLRKKHKPHYFRNFIARRALRIFPLYFLSLAVGLWVLPRLLDTNSFEMAQTEQAYLWTYMSNFRMAWLNEWCFGAFDHFWSLAVEEHFYLVWPAVVLMLSRRRLLIMCILLIVGVGIGRTLAATDSRFDVAVLVATFFRADALAMGALLAILLTSSIRQDKIRQVAWIALVFLFPALIAVAFTGKRLLEVPSTICPMLFAAMMAVILLSCRDVVLAKIFESAPLRLLGKYSYGMYVIQLPLVTLLPMSALATNLPNNPLLAATTYVVTIFAAILSIAILSYHLFESHFLRLKKVFP